VYDLLPSYVEMALNIFSIGETLTTEEIAAKEWWRTTHKALKPIEICLLQFLPGSNPLDISAPLLPKYIYHSIGK